MSRAKPNFTHRLAVVLSHPTQYYSPWFRWLRAQEAVELRVFYLWNFGVTAQRDRQFGTSFQWDVDLLSGYESEFVENTAADPGTHHFGGLRNPTLTARLAAWKPTAILMFGYNWWSHVRAIAWARWSGVPLIFRGDSHFLGRGIPQWRQRWVLRMLYAQFRAFLAVGAANRDYFQTLGVPGRKIFFAPHSVNAALFNPTLKEHRTAAIKLRSELGLGTQTRVVLFAGKFTPAKQPRELLEAFLQVYRPDTVLLMVGDGPEKEALHARARGAENRVRFLPFANQTEMPARLLLADIFVLPSRGHYETWGLAINEAMHMGVPALVSDLVGCARDLVHPDTGWTFSASDPAALQQAVGTALTAVSAPEARDNYRRATQARAAGYTYAQTTAGLIEALKTLPVK